MFMKHTGIIDGLGRTIIVEEAQAIFDAIYAPRGWVTATQGEADAFFGAPNPDDTLVTKTQMDTAIAGSVGSSVATGVVLTGAGIDPTGATDSTSAIQAKIDAAAAAGLAVIVPAGTFKVAGLILRAYTRILGAGLESTTFKLAPSATTDVFISDNFASLTGGATNGGVPGVQLFDFTIDGNKSGAASGKWGIRKYGYRWIIQNVQIRNCVLGGIYSEWSAAPGVGADGGFMEDRLTEVRVHDNGGFGIQWRGPHDSRIEQSLIYANGGVGLSVEGSTTYHAGGILLDTVHAYGNTSHGVQVISTNHTGSDINASTLVSESNGGSGLYLASNGSVVSSGSFYANAAHGIDIQNFAAGYVINAVSFNNTGSQLKFTQDSGNAVITLAAYTATGTQVGVSGTPDATTALLLSGTGNGTGAANRLAVPNALAADAVTGVQFLANVVDGPVVDLTGRSGLDGREILKGQNGTGAYYQVTTDKQVNFENSSGTTQPIKAGSVTADGGLTVGTGAAYFADSVTLRLPTSATTSAGYFWYSATTGRLSYRDGVSSATRDLPVNQTASTTNLASVSDGVNTLGKYAGKQVWNTSSNRPVWATGSTAASTWVFADGTTAHTPV